MREYTQEYFTRVGVVLDTEGGRGPGAVEERRFEAAVALAAGLAAHLARGEALIDLLTNAFKYTGDEKRIRVEAWCAGPTVRISVADNGPGIEKQDLKRVFDRFYRGHDPLQRIIEGSGLGLAMVKHIVAGHGGKIEVASELGKGTTFTVTLPAIEEGRA